jgi:hypothetical protein
MVMDIDKELRTIKEGIRKSRFKKLTGVLRKVRTAAKLGTLMGK